MMRLESFIDSNMLVVEIEDVAIILLDLYLDTKEFGWFQTLS